MRLLSKRIPTVAAVAFTMALAVPGHGEVEVIEAYAATDGGMTRDSLSDANLVQKRPVRHPRATTAHRRKARTDPKDFVASRPYRDHRRTHSQAAAGTTSAPMPKRRAPVVSIVYWWNGWVMRTFHTKFGTVLLGTVGAKS